MWSFNAFHDSIFAFHFSLQVIGSNKRHKSLKKKQQLWREINNKFKVFALSGACKMPGHAKELWAYFMYYINFL